jgi:hypothetical protein
MNALRGTTMGFVFAFGCLACLAQQNTIPFEKIEKDAQLSATLRYPGNEAAGEPYSSSAISAMTPEPSALGAAFTRMTPPARTRLTLGSNFYLLNGLHLGMAVADVEMTQHCLATHQCREGNPLMPSSQAGALSVNLALVGYGSWISYRMKNNHAHMWWISPSSGIAAHFVGFISGAMRR